MNPILFLALISFTLKGIVYNSEDKRPVPYAALQLLEIQKGTYADEDGKFSLDVLKKGKYTLKVSAVGFEEKVVKIRITGDREMKIALKPLFIRLKKVVVTPGTYHIEEEVGPGKGTLSHMDILMLPGAATDPFWALKTLPGVSGGVDNATLAVQGGEPDELAVYVNGLSVPHPFHYEGSGGGLFSFINESLIAKANLYMGGYPASYGNALSGILELVLKNGEMNRGGAADLSMAGASVSLFGTNYELFISRSYTDLISRFSPNKEKFTLYPRTYDIQGVWSHNIGKRSHLSLFALSGWDDTGVDLESEDFEGEYRDHSLKGISGFMLVSLFGPWTLRWSLGGNMYDKMNRVGQPWSWDIFSRELESRLVFERGIGKRALLEFGFSGSRINSRVRAIFPEDSLDWRNPEATSDTLIRRNDFNSGEGFLLTRIALTGKLFGEIGIRGDFFSYRQKRSYDPRFSVSYRDSSYTLRLGGGLYHQLPSFFYLDSVIGNPDLSMMKANHLVFSFAKRMSHSLCFESQVFFKKYFSLPIDIGDTYMSHGKGKAYGVQLLLRRFRGRISGWFAYTYSRSKRASDSSLVEYPSQYDYPHIFSLVGQTYLGKGYELGAKLRYATGGPYTPVIGARKEGNAWIPILGEPNSKRYPDYLRIDVRLTRITSLFGYPFIVYLELLNVLDRENVAGWTYSKDYSERKPISHFGFLPVGGFVLLF